MSARISLGPPDPDACPVGVEGHTWTLSTDEEGHVQLMPVERCTGECTTLVDPQNAPEHLRVSFATRITWWTEHPEGQCPYAEDPCDHDYGWLVVPAVNTQALVDGVIGGIRSDAFDALAEVRQAAARIARNIDRWADVHAGAAAGLSLHELAAQVEALGEPS